MDTIITLTTSAHILAIYLLVYFGSVLITEMLQIKINEKLWWRWVPILNTIAVIMFTIAACSLWAIDKIINKKIK